MIISQEKTTEGVVQDWVIQELNKSGSRCCFSLLSHGGRVGGVSPQGQGKPAVVGSTVSGGQEGRG